MKFVLVGKRAAQLETIKDKINYNNIIVTEKPSELVKDKNTKVIFINASFTYCWDWWMSTDVTNEFNLRKFEDEIMEFRQLDLQDCDYIVDFDGSGMTTVIEKVYNYIMYTLEGR